MKPRIQLPPPFSSEPFTSADARAAGIGEKRLRGADLQHPFHGVRLPGTSRPTLAQLCHAYQRRMPLIAFFCGPTAAALIGIPLPARFEGNRTLHVAMPAPCSPVGGRGIAGHSITSADADTMLWNGLRIGTAERTWFDLGALLTVPELVAASDFLSARPRR